MIYHATETNYVEVLKWAQAIKVDIANQFIICSLTGLLGEDR